MFAKIIIRSLSCLAQYATAVGIIAKEHSELNCFVCTHRTVTRFCVGTIFHHYETPLRRKKYQEDTLNKTSNTDCEKVGYSFSDSIFFKINLIMTL